MTDSILQELNTLNRTIINNVFSLDDVDHIIKKMLACDKHYEIYEQRALRYLNEPMNDYHYKSLKEKAIIEMKTLNSYQIEVVLELIEEIRTRLVESTRARRKLEAFMRYPKILETLGLEGL